MFEVVILAAGYSSRIGKNKMELLINGKPILGYVIEAFYPLCHKITVVGGHYFDGIQSICKSYDKVNLVYNANYSLGMFSSILCGIENVSCECFITPGDYPLITTEIVERIGNTPGDFVVPTYKGKRGHPVKLSFEALKLLKNEPIDSNLKNFRNRFIVDHVEVDDLSILMDIDTMESYEKVKDIKKGVMNN